MTEARAAASRPAKPARPAGTNRARPARRRSDRGLPEGAGQQIAFPFYHDTFTPEERACLAERIDAEALQDEIWLQRVINRRLMQAANRIKADDKDSVAQLARLANAITASSGRMAQLMRDRRALLGQSADGISAAIAKALAEVQSELGVNQ
jgi:Mg-chelatase subunit ChlI